MSFKESITRFLKLSLLFIFIGYYSSTTLFYHAHIVNGEVVVHSHFYKPDSDNKTPFKSHSHPLASYNLIYQLNKINSEELSITSPYEQPILLSQLVVYRLSTPTVSLLTHSAAPSRAPPTF